jgi:L-asparaginase
MTAPTRARVALIGTGGTVSFVGRHSLDLYEYGDHGHILEPDELVAGIPELGREFDVVPVRFRTLHSTRVTPLDWLELNEVVHRVAAADPDLAGIVVTHGTGTLEETAYFLHLTLEIEQTVVVVGSQRPSNGLSSDAALNLLSAVRTAASPNARGLGVLVLLNEEIQSARDVTKTSNHRLQTFQSRDVGLLGYADVDGEIAIYRRPTRRAQRDSEFDPRGLDALPRVDIAYSYAGADGTAIDAFVAAGAQGVVIAALPSGGKPTPDEARAIADARDRGVRVFQSSRAGSGRVLPRASLSELGLVVADNLTPQKARVLAMLALTITEDQAELDRIFREY